MRILSLITGLGMIAVGVLGVVGPGVIPMLATATPVTFLGLLTVLLGPTDRL